MASRTDDQTFLYFGYGSNMNTVRIHMNSPTAKIVAVAKLEGYKLIFAYALGRKTEKLSAWRSPGASIQESAGSHVWGVVWEIHKENLPDLDRQEGVGKGIYKPIEVYVTPDTGQEKMLCRTYQYVPPIKTSNPSPLYKQVLVDGAKQNEIPEEYIRKLEALEDNGNTDVSSKVAQDYLRLWEEHQSLTQ